MFANSIIPEARLIGELQLLNREKLDDLAAGATIAVEFAEDPYQTPKFHVGTITAIRKDAIDVLYNDNQVFPHNIDGNHRIIYQPQILPEAPLPSYRMHISAHERVTNESQTVASMLSEMQAKDSLLLAELNRHNNPNLTQLRAELQNLHGILTMDETDNLHPETIAEVASEWQGLSGRINVALAQYAQLRHAPS